MPQQKPSVGDGRSGLQDGHSTEPGNVQPPRKAAAAPHEENGAARGGPLVEPPPRIVVKDLPPDPPAAPRQEALALNVPAARHEPAIPPARPTPDVSPAMAKVAIVIDDFGQDLEMARKFLALPFPVTFAVMPHQLHSREIADLARSSGREVILHLPMEPQGYPKVDPGRGALLLAMPETSLKKEIDSALDVSPHFKGVNNHMGSRFTEDSRQMKVVLSELKRRGLYFLDSQTSAGTVGGSVARELKVPTRRRDIFLDHKMTEEFVRSQLIQLIRKARVEGSAVAIGHPYECTLKVLRQEAARFRQEQVTVVPAGELMKSGS